MRFSFLLLLLMAAPCAAAGQRRADVSSLPVAARSLPDHPPAIAWRQGGEPRLGRYTKVGLGVGAAAGALLGLSRCHDDCAGRVLVTSAFLGFVGFGVGCALDSSLDPGTPYRGCSFLASPRGR